MLQRTALVRQLSEAVAVYEEAELEGGGQGGAAAAACDPHLLLRLCYSAVELGVVCDPVLERGAREALLTAQRLLCSAAQRYAMPGPAQRTPWHLVQPQHLQAIFPLARADLRAGRLL